MNIIWNWNHDDNFLGEHLPADTLDREKYANYIYEICAARGENSNLVININAEWGAGKTYFTKRLAKTISSFHPTVYIDAWKEDFSDDPLLTVFSAIKEQLTGQSDKFTTLLNKTISNIGPLLKTATPVILEGLAKKYIGVDAISDLAKDLSSRLLELHSEKSAKIESIKNGISEWVRFIKQQDGIEKKLPLFIVIDELDRCRPDFAISLLEITKHIFNIPGVVFIVATDTEQLQHSIKVVYGNNFSASHYLNRFFDRRFLLPTPKLAEFLKTISGSTLSKEFHIYKKKISPSPPDIISFSENCASILEALNINLRDSIKLYQRLTDAILITKKNIDPFLLLILSAINIHNNEIYRSFKNQRADASKEHFMNEEITLTFDLSKETTGVNHYQLVINDIYRHTNDMTTKEITVTIGSYINTAQGIITIEDPSSKNDSSNYPIQWSNGGIVMDNSLNTYLKMGWALTKNYEKSLTLPQYYDLIELSTTFE